MNILLAESSHDGPSWTAFNLDSLNLELKHHKDLFDAVKLCLSQPNVGHKIFGEGNGRFGDIIFTLYGELCEEQYFIGYMLKGEAEFSDEESEDYDPRYTNITLQPPFQIDVVLTLKTFG